MTEDNAILVGNKPFMNYITAIVMQFATKNASEVVVKARGNLINSAVDASMVASKRFLEGKVKVKNVVINSEEVTNREGKKRNISSIEITLEKV
ncbi:DNA/RNA-binding protein AlbA [Candidatus Woesearchaeota archaeon]|nr:DNA/RNA-binding protein AlbA [Candidatus Woesearchaeota archaeon]